MTEMRNDRRYRLSYDLVGKTTPIFCCLIALLLSEWTLRWMPPAGNMMYVIFTDGRLNRASSVKTIYEMTSELAKRLGVEQQFTEGRTQEEWMRHLYEQSRKSIPEICPP